MKEGDSQCQSTRFQLHANLTFKLRGVLSDDSDFALLYLF